MNEKVLILKQIPTLQENTILTRMIIPIPNN
jgi:hypothetical protein